MSDKDNVISELQNKIVVLEKELEKFKKNKRNTVVLKNGVYCCEQSEVYCEEKEENEVEKEEAKKKSSVSTGSEDTKQKLERISRTLLKIQKRQSLKVPNKIQI